MGYTNVDELVERSIVRDVHPRGEIVQKRLTVYRHMPPAGRICRPLSEYCLQPPGLLVVNHWLQQMRRMTEEREVCQLPACKLRIRFIGHVRRRQAVIVRRRRKIVDESGNDIDLITLRPHYGIEGSMAELRVDETPHRLLISIV